MRIAICQTDPKLMELLVMRTTALAPDATVTRLACVGALMSFLEDGALSADVLITDVEADGCDCITLLKDSLPPGCALQIVFASRLVQRVWDAYAVRHTAFVPPHFTSERLGAALALCRANIAALPRPCLTMSNQGLVTRIPLDEILYLESDLHRLYVHTVHGKRTFFAKIDAALPFLDYRFYQCHKSYVVNMARVRQLEKPAEGARWVVFTLENGESIPVSTRRQRLAREAFGSYTAQHAPTRSTFPQKER